MKKGFTLIELLAVILILGIIALIAIPQVTNVIDKASRGAAETSGEHYISAVNTKIGLNKLDSDSSNDITDGMITATSITVDMTGDAPTSGNVLVIDGIVKQAELEVNGKTLLCDAKGKCTAIDKYVYYQGSGELTDINQTVPERPTQYNAYLKIPVINNELGNPQVCAFDTEKEICISNNEYETSKYKILNYFGYDKSTWTLNPTNNLDWVYSTKTCRIDVNYPEGKATFCFHDDLALGEPYADTEGKVSSQITLLQSGTYYNCRIGIEGTASCQ